MPDDQTPKSLKEQDELPLQRRTFNVVITKRAAAPQAGPAAEGARGAPAGDGEDEELYDVSLSSEEPVDRWWGREILLHGKENINLERTKDGLPLLASHNSRSLPIGRMYDFRVDDGKLRAGLRFSKIQAGRDAKTLVDEGHREMSIGYSIDEYEVTPGKADEPSVFRATRWTPMEGSIVAVPADHTIGVGRNSTGVKYPVHVRNLPKAGSTGVTTMPDDNAPPARAGADSKVAAEIVRRAALHGCSDQVADWLDRGLTLEQVNEEILAKRATAPSKQPAAEQLELSEKERKEYSYARAIIAGAEARDGRAKNCFELEISQDLEKSMPMQYKRNGGIFVPTTLRGGKFKQELHMSASADLQRQLDLLTRVGIIDSVTTNAIKETVFTVYGGELIEMLRNTAMVVAMGARVLTGLDSPVGFPRQTGDVSANWVAENPGADVTASNVTTDIVTLAPKTLQATTAYTRQLLVQSSIDVEAMVRGSIAAAHGLAWDKAALHGTGSNNQPTGIYNTANVLTVDFSDANFSNTGQLIAYTGVVEMETQVAAANALLSALGYLTTPNVAGRAKRTLEFAGAAIAQGMRLWNGKILDGEMNGYTARATNQVSKLLGTNGVASPAGTYHGLTFGNWADLLVGQFGGALELIVDPYAQKKRGIIEVTSFQMCDIALRHPVSFCIGINLNK
jgi:HK97 family phage major capsid protein